MSPGLAFSLEIVRSETVMVQSHGGATWTATGSAATQVSGREEEEVSGSTTSQTMMQLSQLALTLTIVLQVEPW